MNEWIEIFVKRFADNKFEFGYLWNNNIYSTIVSDSNTPIAGPGAFYLWGCDGYSASNYFDDVCYTPIVGDFCDGFEDGEGWSSRWTTYQGSQTYVSSPTHSGQGALEFHGGCHSSIFPTGFEASYGEYTAYVNQQHSIAHFSVYTQFREGDNPDPNPTAHTGL